MRGDRLGVGDIGALPCGARGSGDASCCHDSWITIREHERGMVGACCSGQRDASGKQCRNRIGASDGTRVEPWACWFDGDGAIRADGMRGDRVGVRDIGAVPCGARGSGNASCGDDGRGAARQYDGSTLSGPWFCERHVVSREPSGDRVGVGDGARGEHGACWLDGDGAVRADGMRGDRVEVGDVGAMPCGARGSGDASCGDDGRGAAR